MLQCNTWSSFQILIELETALLDDIPHWYKLQTHDVSSIPLPQPSPYLPRRHIHADSPSKKLQSMSVHMEILYVHTPVFNYTTWLCLSRASIGDITWYLRILLSTQEFIGILYSDCYLFVVSCWFNMADVHEKASHILLCLPSHVFASHIKCLDVTELFSPWREWGRQNTGWVKLPWQPHSHQGGTER